MVVHSTFTRVDFPFIRYTHRCVFHENYSAPIPSRAHTHTPSAVIRRETESASESLSQPFQNIVQRLVSVLADRSSVNVFAVRECARRMYVVCMSFYSECLRLYGWSLGCVCACEHVEHVCPYGCQNSIKINKLSGSSLLATKKKERIYNYRN